MKKFYFILLIIITSSFFFWQSANAEEVKANYFRHPPLNRVMLQLRAEEWATTSLANVVVNVDAALNSGGLADVHQQMLQKLAKISDADWHITQFNRTQDQTGLERVQATAEARIVQSNLATIRDNAKNVSKPGEKYTIQDIQFTPTLAETEKLNADLRNKIYQQAQDELSRLNKIYPDAHYTLHAINFLGFFADRTPLFKRTMMMEGAAAPVAAPPVMVGDKIILTATVVLAAPMQKAND